MTEQPDKYDEMARVMLDRKYPISHTELSDAIRAAVREAKDDVGQHMIAAASEWFDKNIGSRALKMDFLAHMGIAAKQYRDKEQSHG